MVVYLVRQFILLEQTEIVRCDPIAMPMRQRKKQLRSRLTHNYTLTHLWTVSKPITVSYSNPDGTK